MKVLRILKQVMHQAANIQPALVGIIGVTLLATACNTASTKQSANPGEVSDEAVASNEQRVCREVEVTGSHFKRKICRSASTWRAIDASERRATDGLTGELNERSTISPDGGGVDSSGGRSMGPTTGF